MAKSVQHQHHKPTRKLGRKPRGFSGAIPHYSALRRMDPHLCPPLSADWLKGMPDELGMMLNDTLGDCTCAGLGHARQVWTYNATGAIVTVPDADMLALYEAGCGYVDGDPSTDQGGSEQDLLAYCVRTGIPTPSGPDKLLAFVELDPRQHDDAKSCIADGLLVYMGISIPEAWTQAQAGDTWDVTDSPLVGGHCVIAAGYDSDGLAIISWGMRFRMTWAAWDRYVDEAYWLIDKASFGVSGKTPSNLTLADLEAAMQAVRAA